MSIGFLMSRRHRLFIAVELSPEVTTHAARVIARLQATQIQAKWVEPGRMHLTMQFLGDVDELEIPTVCRVMDETGAEMEPFDVEIGGAGAFPNLDAPRTLWLGIRRGGEDLIELHDRLDARLRPLGFRSEDRRFRPHLTIGRLRENEPTALTALAAELGQLTDLHAGVVDVCDFALFVSTPKAEGSGYEVLHTADFNGRS
jgi:2'-5' RNA ligase